ncbi:MAG TPA: GDSL-type esterase/lipase family protein [Acetobacteraceae bacterium]
MTALSRRGLLAAAVSLPAPRTPLAAQPISRMDTGWWRQRHAAKLAEAKSRRIELVFLGDSITQQYEDGGPPPWRDFRPVWQRFYGDRNALNLGFSGDATAHLLWRMRNGEIDGISPRAAVILIGANNLGRLHWPTEDNIAGINAVVAEAQKRMPHTKLLLLGILPSERTPWATQTTAEVNRALAARYGKDGVAGITYLDVGPVFMQGGSLNRALFYDPLLTPPGPPLHPTAEGQARMAGAIEPVLAKLMGDRDHTR